MGFNKRKRKTRRKPNLKNPNSRTWKKKADDAWNDAPGSRYCEVCETLRTVVSHHRINNHHIISRTNLRYRHNLKNRLRLCATHHTGGTSDICAHGDLDQVNKFEQWFALNKPEQYSWWLEHKDDKRKRTESYEDAFYRLKGTSND